MPRYKHKKKDEIINITNLRILYNNEGSVPVDLDGRYPNLAKDYVPYEMGGTYDNVSMKKNPNDRHY